jgi:hypothetical protein
VSALPRHGRRGTARRYGDCSCKCHVVPNVHHAVACCHAPRPQELDVEDAFQFMRESGAIRPRFVVVVKLDGTVVHLVGYEEEPSKADLAHLRQELREDGEFGLCGCVDELTFEVQDRRSA